MTTHSSTLGTVSLCLLALLGCVSGGIITSVIPASGDVPVDPALEEFIRSTFACEKDTTVNECIDKGITTTIETVRTGIEFALLDGSLPETQLGPIGISGKNIDLSGVDTLSASDAVVQGSTLFLTLILDELHLEGDFTVALPIFGRHEIHLEIGIKGLKAPVAVVFAENDGKLLIEDFDIKPTFDDVHIVVNKGGPIITKKVPFVGLINTIAQKMLKGLTNKKVLQYKVLPLMIKIFKPNLLKLINGFLQNAS